MSQFVCFEGSRATRSVRQRVSRPLPLVAPLGSTQYENCSQVCQMTAASSRKAPRTALQIVASAKADKRQQVVLVENVPELGPKGTLTVVKTGYFRNYLYPQRLAQKATSGVLAQIQREQDAAEKEALQVKAKAKAMAIALQTINKFRIKKKVGENDQIFGSVTTQEVVDAIEQQTGRQLDRRLVTLPEIKSVGTFDASVKLHPEVVGEFKIVVQREKQQG